MVKHILDSDAASFACEQCGSRYTEKQWAEKCEAWCAKYHQCNAEIAAHALPEAPGEETAAAQEAGKQARRSFWSVLASIFKQPLYIFLAFDGALALGVLYWWLLSKTTTWANFSSMYSNVPIYFWPYVSLTLLGMIFFGMSLAVSVYSWQHSRLRIASDESGNVLGATVGAFAAACPVCGSFLLSAIGITGGVALLPFKGLELKLLSVLFFAGALVFGVRKLARAENCEACEVQQQETSGVRKASDPLFSYQTLAAVSFLILLLAAPLWNRELIAASTAAKDGTLLMNKVNNVQGAEAGGNTLYNTVVAAVLPQQGFQTKIMLDDAIVKLVKNGIIDVEKFKEVYKSRGFSEEELALLTAPSYKPLTINAKNAGVLINLFWPLGLSNKTKFNEQSPMNSASLFNFASTGGWTLGKENNGGAYFNKYEIVKLTPAQEAIALEVAQNTYRPCCGNSSFFQDCNHGSALLGVIELGAAQGLSKEELYRVALQFNSFWFPQTYVNTALYYKLAKNIDWENVNPKEVMGANYSSGPGWAKNIAQPLQEIIAKNPNLIPKQQGGGGGCGV